jgi:hypothetical protein
MSTTPQSLLLALAAAVTLLPLGCGAPVKTPTSYAKWEPKSDAIFAIDYPEGWLADGNGKNGVQWAEFKKSGCLIKCSTDQSSSLVGDITQSANNMLGGGEGGLSEEELEDLAPAAAAHQWNKDKAKEDYSKYKEEKEMIAFKSGLGDARKSIFTGTIGGRSVKGYRATFLARDRGVTVICHCAAKDFERLQPAFDKVLESVRRGNS